MYSKYKNKYYKNSMNAIECNIEVASKNSMIE